MEVVEVPGDELAGVVGGTIGRRGPTVIGKPGPLEAPGCPGSGVEGGGRATGGFDPEVITRPVPLSATVCGLPVALSMIVRVPVLVPGPKGVKTTAMEPFPPAHILVPQVLVWEKSPPVETLRMSSEAPPVLVRVTV